MEYDIPNVGRRCLAHVTIRCTSAECIADEVDLRTNPNRVRPKATEGAPEVSWGLNGVLRSIAKPVQPVTDLIEVPTDLALGLAYLKSSAFNGIMSEGKK